MIDFLATRYNKAPHEIEAQYDEYDYYLAYYFYAIENYDTAWEIHNRQSKP